MSAKKQPEESAQVVYDWSDTSHSWIENVMGVLTGVLLVSLGLTILRSVNAVTGGTAGLALFLGYATPWQFPVWFALINLPFAVLAVWQRGWAFTLRTGFAIVAVSVLSVWTADWLPLADPNPLFAVLIGNLLNGVGLLILFRHGTSLGGVNVVALVVQDRTGFRAGWTQMIFDVCIIALSLTVIPWQMVLLSAAGAVLLNLVIALNHRPGRYIGH